MPDTAKPIEQGLTIAQKRYKKLLEEENASRANKLIRLTVKNRKTGLLLGAVAASIYGYTIYSVKQEDFLNDLED